MIIALPLTETDEFSPHFGAAAKAGLYTVDVNQRRILKAAMVVPPAPEPCGWADWLGSRGVKVFLTGGMGQGAQQRMAAAGIEVIAGVSAGAPMLLVQAWLNRELKPGANGCEGGHEHGHTHSHEKHSATGGCCCTE